MSHICNYRTMLDCTVCPLLGTPNRSLSHNKPGGLCLASPPLSAHSHACSPPAFALKHAVQTGSHLGASQLKRLIATCYLLNKIHTPCLYILGNCQLAFRELSAHLLATVFDLQSPDCAIISMTLFKVCSPCLECLHFKYPPHQTAKSFSLVPIFTGFFFGRSVPYRHVGSQFLNQGSNLCPLWWTCGVLTTGPAGSPIAAFLTLVSLTANSSMFSGHFCINRCAT